MNRLKEIDRTLYCTITESHDHTFWFHPLIHSHDLVRGYYSIPDAYCVWGESGIIAKLVEAAFTDHVLQRRVMAVLRKGAAVTNRLIIDDRTRAWLQSHDFPSELVETYGGHEGSSNSG